MVSKKEVLRVLNECYDPEIPVSVVDLGLIYGIKIENGKVKVKMTLTNPFCPMSYRIIEDVKEKIRKVKGVKDVEVEITFDPPWNPNMMSKKARKLLGF